MTRPDYKSLLIKYVNHVKFHEGIDYLSEGYQNELTEEETIEIQAAVSAKATSDATLDKYFLTEGGKAKVKEVGNHVVDAIINKVSQKKFYCSYCDQEIGPLQHKCI